MIFNYLKFIKQLILKYNSFNPKGHTTPAPSVHGSDDEDSVDEDRELQELAIHD